MRIVAALLLLSACAKKPEEPAIFQPDPATVARLEGTIRTDGIAKPTPLSMSADADCEKLHTGPVERLAFVAGPSGELAQAFVYIKKGLEGKKFATPESVVLDQRGCLFTPRVIGLQTGQYLEVKNSDPVSHNVHPMPQNNRDWNQQQAPGAPDLRRRFAFPEVLIPVKCNIHAWMRSWIAVLDHPYFAVTGPDGRFEWPNVPPGEYEVAVWHETFGERTQTVTLPPRGAATVNFTLPQQ